MTTRFLSRALIAALLLVPAAMATAADAQAPAAPAASSVAPPSIVVAAARERELVAEVVVVGTLQPRETVSVGADVEGLRIVELLADEGDVVEAGAVLARLSTDLIETDVLRAEAQRARAEAAIAQAGATVAEAEALATETASALERTRALAEGGIVGREVLDQRVSAAASAEARLLSARQGVVAAEAERAAADAEIRQLELRRSKAEVRAPAGGLVLSRAARLGAIASAGGGALFEIARDGLIELDAEASETVLGRLEADQTASVELAGGTSVEGTVRLVSPTVDPATRLGRVRIALPESPALRTGAFARGRISTDRSVGVVVPRTAVVTDETRSTVQVVADGVVETRVVELGISAGSEIEIRDGLVAGESVVARAGSFVRDGDRVTPVESGEGAGAPASAPAPAVTAENAR